MLKQLCLEDRRLARKIANHLEDQHKNHKSQCKLAPDFLYKGFCGQIHFGREFGIPFIFVDQPGGDGGIDYDVGMTIDVKTVTLANFRSMREAMPKRHLMVKEGQSTADIYVLCGYKPDAMCILMGWETGPKVGSVKPEVFPAFGGISNHVIVASMLEPVEKLKRIINRPSSTIGVPDNAFGGLF